MLFVVIAILVMAIVCTTLLVRKGERWDIPGTLLAFSIILWIFFLGTTFWGVALYDTSVGDYGQMYAFKETEKVYMQTIDMVTTKASVMEPYMSGRDVSGGVSINVGLENMKQSTNNTSAMTDYRNIVVSYQSLLGKYKAANRTWFYRWAIAPTPKEFLE